MLKNKLQKLSIEGIEIYSNHGVYEFEKNSTNLFIIDVYLESDFSKSMISDNLEDTIDYQVIYELVSAEMSIHSDLIEHIAYRMAQSIKNKIKSIVNLKLKISKINPPLRGKVGKTTFEVEL